MSQSQRTSTDKTRAKAGKAATATHAVATVTPAATARSPLLSTSTIINQPGLTKKITNDQRDEIIEKLCIKIDGLEHGATDNLVSMKGIIEQISQDISDTTSRDIARLTAVIEDSNRQHAEDMERITTLLGEKTRAFDQITSDLLRVQHLLTVTQRHNTKMEISLNDLSNQAKLCNLKIDGKPEDPKEDLRLFVTDLAKCLDANPKSISSAYRVGKIDMRRQNQQHDRFARPRSIMIVFDSIAERNRFFFARMQLKGSQKYGSIYVNDDVTPLTYKWRDEFRSVAALARASGSDVRVHGDGVIIDGIKHRHTNPGSLPNKYSLEKAKMRMINGGIYFQSEHAYMSNFYPSFIKSNEVHYATAEHFYQAEKCRQAGDAPRVQKVIAAESPLEAKKIADQIAETPEWRNARLQVMEMVITKKFEQNTDLKKRLVETGDTPLFEATKNGFFGIGATLNSRELRDRSYKGLNKLGLALQELRNKLKARSSDN